MAPPFLPSLVSPAGERARKFASALESWGLAVVLFKGQREGSGLDQDDPRSGRARVLRGSSQCGARWLIESCDGRGAGFIQEREEQGGATRPPPERAGGGAGAREGRSRRERGGGR